MKDFETQENEAPGGTCAADCSVPLVKYDPTPLPDKPGVTDWLGVTLESGAEVRVGLQTDHPHGGLGLVHEMRNTQPDTGERTRLVFCLSPEAAGALVALYVAHGIINAPNMKLSNTVPDKYAH